MTKPEKIILSFIIVLLILLALNTYYFVIPLMKQVEQRGIKSIVSEIWNGKGQQR